MFRENYIVKLVITFDVLNSQGCYVSNKSLVAMSYDPKWRMTFISFS
jgi:hypothetical protein